MPRKEILDQIQKYTQPFRITNGKRFQLKDFDPRDTRGLKMDKMLPNFFSAAPSGSPTNRTGFTPRIVGRCSLSSRPWTRPARTARSNTSCRE